MTKLPPIDIKKTLQEVSYDGIKIPEPKFDKDPLEIIEELKSKFDSKQAITAGPIGISPLKIAG